jgi:hypothetical protein
MVRERKRKRQRERETECMRSEGLTQGLLLKSSSSGVESWEGYVWIVGGGCAPADAAVGGENSWISLRQRGVWREALPGNKERKGGGGKQRERRRGNRKTGSRGGATERRAALSMKVRSLHGRVSQKKKECAKDSV